MSPCARYIILGWDIVFSLSIWVAHGMSVFSRMKASPSMKYHMDIDNPYM